MQTIASEDDLRDHILELCAEGITTVGLVAMIVANYADGGDIPEVHQILISAASLVEDGLLIDISYHYPDMEWRQKSFLVGAEAYDARRYKLPEDAIVENHIDSRKQLPV